MDQALPSRSGPRPPSVAVLPSRCALLILSARLNQANAILLLLQHLLSSMGYGDLDRELFLLQSFRKYTGRYTNSVDTKDCDIRASTTCSTDQLSDPRRCILAA
ncbi:hypothetical protein BX600DRAFT_282536 [Xylariales sp. PMI_506]|nr:hypothetical protein BX600DRAFT_282536 [Xylariales sp. PMI_506]